jgi:hypothetical protein
VQPGPTYERKLPLRNRFSLNVTPATFHNAARPKTPKKPVSDSHHSGCILAPSPSPRTVIQDPYQEMIGRSLAQIDLVLPQRTNQHIPTCSVAPPCGDLPCDTQAGESVAETRCSIGRLGHLKSRTERRQNAGSYLRSTAPLVFCFLGVACISTKQLVHHVDYIHYAQHGGNY